MMKKEYINGSYQWLVVLNMFKREFKRLGLDYHNTKDVKKYFKGLKKG